MGCFVFFLIFNFLFLAVQAKCYWVCECGLILKYLHDHVCARATYMDMHTHLCMNTSCVFFKFTGWERVHSVLFVVVVELHRLTYIDFSTLKKNKKHARHSIHAALSLHRFPLQTFLALN